MIGIPRNHMCRFASLFEHFSLFKFTSFHVLLGGVKETAKISSPPNKTWKLVNLNRQKVFKRLANLHIWFLGIPITMHYVITLCDKCFLSYYGFSALFTGTSRYRVRKHGVGVKCDTQGGLLHTSHPILMVLTPFYAMCLLKLWFFRNDLL